MLDHGDLTVRKRSLLFLSLLVPAFSGLGGYAVLQAQQKTSTASGKRWSDATTWPDKKVPAKGLNVVIDRDMNLVVLDVTPPALHGLTISNEMSFADNKEISNCPPSGSWCTGSWRLAWKPNPTRTQATIILTRTTSKTKILVDWVETDRSDRGIMLMGGTLNLHGTEKNSWTKLAQTAASAGNNAIQVLTPAEAGRKARRLFSRPRISIPARQRSGPLPPSVAIRSRSTGN